MITDLKMWWIKITYLFLVVLFILFLLIREFYLGKIIYPVGIHHQRKIKSRVYAQSMFSRDGR